MVECDYVKTESFLRSILGEETYIVATVSRSRSSLSMCFLSLVSKLLNRFQKLVER